MKLIDRLKAAVTGEITPTNDYEAVVAERDALKAEITELTEWLDGLKTEAAEAKEDAHATKEAAEAAVAAAETKAAETNANAQATVAAIVEAGLPADAIKATAPVTAEGLRAQMAGLKTTAERKEFFEAHKAILTSDQ